MDTRVHACVESLEGGQGACLPVDEGVEHVRAAVLGD